MSGRNVSVRVHALQSLNQSLFECVAHHVFQLDAVGSLCGPVAIFVGIDWRVFGRHEAIRSCGEVNDLIVWFLGEGLPSVDLAHGDLS